MLVRSKRSISGKIITRILLVILCIVALSYSFAHHLYSKEVTSLISQLYDRPVEPYEETCNNACGSKLYHSNNQIRTDLNGKVYKIADYPEMVCAQNYRNTADWVVYS